MAICDPSSLLSANPFVALSDGHKLAAECKMIQDWAGSTEDISTVLGRAYDFVGLSEGEALAVEAKLLSVIAGEDDPNALLLNSRFITLDDGLRDCAKLRRLYELSGQSGDIDSLFLNNKFLYVDNGLAIAAKLRLLADIAYGVGTGSASTALLYNPFYNLSDGLTRCCINELLCLSSSGIADEIQAVTTQTGTSATENLSLSNEFDAIRVWTGETPVTEPWFFLYVTRSGSTTKIKMNRFEARIINVPGGSFGLATSDGRTVYIAPDSKPSALGTSFPVSGTANADAGGPPIWYPSAAHITLPVGQSQYELVGSGTERVVFVSEYDGATWSPPRWLRLPASGSVRMHATFRQIALANYDGATVSVNGPTGTVIGGTSVASSLVFPAVTGTTRNVTDVATFKTAIAAAVAGDEIVLAAGTYNMDVNITAASFTSNNGVGGRVGMEGITIRGATSDRTLYVIGVSGGAGDWTLSGQGLVVRSAFKDLTFSFGANAANFTLASGLWSVQNCAFSGSTGTTAAATTDINVIFYKCDFSNAGVDCFDHTNGSVGASCSLVACTGSTSGPLASDQVLTAHKADSPLKVYGGSFENSHSNVAAVGTLVTLGSIYAFFTRFAKGARRAGLNGVRVFACNHESSDIKDTTWPTNGFVVGSKICNGITEATNQNYRIEGNLCTPEPAHILYWYFPYNNTTTSEVQRNVAVGYTTGIRFNFGTTGSVAARGNTLVSSGIAASIVGATMGKTLTGNVSRLSSTRGITSDTTGMASSTVNFNIWDGTPSASYIPGANDTTGVNADLDANHLPTASGNCDGTGNPASVDWVGGTDYVGFLLEISDVTRDRGARCRPRIITGAPLTPDIW